MAPSLALPAGGCAVGPDYHTPAASADSSYTAAPQPGTTSETTGPGGAAQHFFTTRSDNYLRANTGKHLGKRASDAGAATSHDRNLLS